MTRVLHVIPAVAARYGGPSRAVFGMCRALQEREVDVTIATTDADGAGALAVPRGGLVSYDGVPTIFFRRQWSERFKYSWPMAEWLHQHVKEFDVVHIHAVFSHVCLAAGRACQRNGVPYVVRPLGSLDPWSLRHRPLAKWVVLRMGAGRMLRKAAAIHYTTCDEQRLAETALGLGPGAVVPLGVDSELLDESHLEAQVASEIGVPAFPYILSLGRLHEKKGLDLLIDAFREAVTEPNLAAWRLVIAGDGEPSYVAGLQARAAGVGDRVIFSGWLDGRRRVAALRGAGVVAAPSHQENFGLSVVEALACGVPVVVSPQVNLATEIAEAGAGWVASRDCSALAAVLREAMVCEDERVRRGRAGQDLVRRRFTWASVAGQLHGMYQTVATHRMSMV